MFGGCGTFGAYLAWASTQSVSAHYSCLTDESFEQGPHFPLRQPLRDAGGLKFKSPLVRKKNEPTPAHGFLVGVGAG